MGAGAFVEVFTEDPTKVKLVYVLVAVFGSVAVFVCVGVMFMRRRNKSSNKSNKPITIENAIPGVQTATPMGDGSVPSVLAAAAGPARTVAQHTAGGVRFVTKADVPAHALG